MSDERSTRVPRRSRPGGLRTSVVAAVTLLTLGLSGCGEPDDDGGGGGGGYLAQQLIGAPPVPAGH